MIRLRTGFQMLLVGCLVVLLSSLAPMAQVAHGGGGDEGTAQTQGDNSIWSQMNRYLESLFGNEAAVPGGGHQSGAGKRVGLQAGHWRYQESPPPLNAQTGTSGGGKTEPEVTLDIAQRTAKILEDKGYAVDILPAWFPKGYSADAVVAIHADGAANPEARGFFADRYSRSAIPEADDRFMTIMDEEYAAATGLPFKYRSTDGSRYYYGYTLVRVKTPMALIETGFLTNEVDRQIIVDDPDRSAQGIAAGIDRFLTQ
ncbi:MAG: N-acetylmuramoyl-L-alanine amidase [Chloroflexi bacterium]|nr:N-acetylmuramoyl-L-alanine amidase [Chloroflexota bacterium]